MSFLKKIRETPPTATAPAADPTSEKPLPELRPGTSGTEALLITNRRRASEHYQKAHRAERAYRTKKRATAARRDYSTARDHYCEALRHLKEGLRMTFSVVKSAPYVAGEKREQMRLKSDEKRRQRAMEKKKRLEERLAKESLEAEEEGTEKGKEAEEGEASK